MNRQKIETILRLNPPTTSDLYTHEVARILKAPSWIHPIKRRKFNKQFVNRVQLVLSEHTVAILEGIAAK